MRERFNPVLKLICLALAALILYQLSRLALRTDPLGTLSFTAISILPAAPETPPGKKETNSVPRQEPPRKGTNAVARRASPPKGVDVPPEIQTRVDRITQSEILGTVVRPLPMALLGIAGQDAFLRAPDGQTGLLREGEELGGIKLLRIGTNRVLIEHEQQQKELTVFSGLGSETLLPKGKAKPQ
jgi:hypothetical protein